MAVIVSRIECSKSDMNNKTMLYNSWCVTFIHGFEDSTLLIEQNGCQINARTVHWTKNRYILQLHWSIYRPLSTLSTSVRALLITRRIVLT